MNKDPYLSNAGIGEGKLRQDINADGKLSQAEESDTELGDIDHADGELADGNDAFGGHRHPVGAILERNVDQGPTQERAFRFIFKSPAIPFLPGRIGCAAAGTMERLFTYLMSAFSACFHIDTGRLLDVIAGYPPAAILLKHGGNGLDCRFLICEGGLEPNDDIFAVGSARQGSFVDRAFDFS